MKSILVTLKAVLLCIVINVHVSVLSHTMQKMAAVDLVLIDRSEILVKCINAKMLECNKAQKIFQMHNKTQF